MYAWRSYTPAVMARDWREDRIEELERENAQLRARVREQQAVIETQQQSEVSPSCR